MHDHWIEDWEETLRKEIPEMSCRLERDVARVRDVMLSHDVYIFRNKKLEQIGEEISEESEISRLPKLLWQAAVISGFENASLFVLRQGTKSIFKSRACSSYPARWRQQYIEKKYQFIDPVVSLASRCETAFTFSQAKGTSPIEADFWADAERHRAGTNGLAIPIQLECAALIVVTFATSSNKHIADVRCKEHMSDLSFIARLAVEAFGCLGRSQPNSKAALTQDELRYLYILLTSDDPTEARSLRSAFGSAVSIERGIQEKLGVKSILQAIAIASKYDFFDQLDWQESDINPLLLELSGWGLVESYNDESYGIGTPTMDKDPNFPD